MTGEGTSPLNVPGVLARRTENELYTLAGKPSCGFKALGETALAVADKLFHGAVNGKPNTVQGFNQFVLSLIRDDACCIPAGASIDKV